MMKRFHKNRSRWALALLAPLVSGALAAQVTPPSHDTLASLAFQSERLAPSQPVAPLDDHLAEVKSAVNNAWTAFRLATRAEWRGWIDRRTGRIARAEGGNVAWVPGHGNSLPPGDLAALLGRKKVDMAALETIARRYLPK